MSTYKEYILCKQIYNLNYILIPGNVTFQSDTDYFITGVGSSFNSVYFNGTLEFLDEINGEITNDNEDTVYTFNSLTWDNKKGKLMSNNPDIIIKKK